jgi:hypothetical protein
MRGATIYRNAYRDCIAARFDPYWRGDGMSKIDRLKAEIESLPSEEIAEIFRWLSEKDWEKWDREIEADSESGRLEFLVREAHDEKSKGTLKDL